MPEDWISILAKVSIPEIHLTLYWDSENSTTSTAHPIMEIAIAEIKTKVQLG